ncbi:MAG: hypothetical protein RJB13_2417 [Pseudomonadota bacterium]
MRYWSFNRKIALSSLTVVIAFAVFAVAALAGLLLLEKSFNSYYTRFENVQRINQIQHKIRDIRLVETDAILESELSVLSTYPNQTADLFKAIESEVNSIAVRPELQSSPQSIEKLKAALLRRKEHSDQILRAAVSGDSDTAMDLYDFADQDKKQLQELISSTLAELSASELNRVIVLKQEFNSLIRNWTVWIALLSLACIALVPSIVHSIMNSVRRNLGRSADNLLDSAHKIEPLIEKIGSFGSKFGEGRDKSHSALQKSGSAIQMLADSLVKHADSMGKTANYVALNSDETMKSQAATETIAAAFEKAQGNNDALIEKIDTYSARIENVLRTISSVSDKTKIVNDFIFQTKIISLNASVEAARAGELGRGFSIVAEELAHLSQSSGQSAKDIATLLESGLTDVDLLMRESQRDFKHLLSSSREVIERGSFAASQCSESVSALAETTRDLSELVEESGQALQMQLESFASVNESIKQLNETALDDSTLSARYADSVQELTEQSDNLRGLARSLATSLKGAYKSSLRSRMNNNNNNNSSNVMEQNIISQDAKEPENDEMSTPVIHGMEARRRRPKSFAQRRMKEQMTAEPKSPLSQNPENLARRKA